MRLIAVSCAIGVFLSGCSGLGSYSSFERTAFYGADSDFKYGSNPAFATRKDDPNRGVRRFNILTTDEETELFKALERARELHAQLRIYEVVTAVAINRQKELVARTKLANTKLAHAKLANAKGLSVKAISAKRNIEITSPTAISLNTARLTAQDTSKVARASESNLGKGRRENVGQLNASAKAAASDKAIIPATWRQVNKHLSKQPL